MSYSSCNLGHPLNDAPIIHLQPDDRFTRPVAPSAILELWQRSAQSEWRCANRHSTSESWIKISSALTVFTRPHVHKLLRVRVQESRQHTLPHVQRQALRVLVLPSKCLLLSSALTPPPETYTPMRLTLMPINS